MVPEKKAKEKATGTRKSSRRPVSSDLPDGPNAPSASEDEEEEEEEDASPPPTGGGKKRKASPTGEARGSKKGKTLLPDYASDAEDGGRNGHPGSSPWQNCKCPVTQMTYGVPLLFGNF